MITNMGVIDGVFRLVLGIGLLALSYGRFRFHLPHDLAWAVWSIGAFLAFTGLFRSCPVLALLGTDSCAIYPGHDRQSPTASTLDKGDPSA